EISDDEIALLASNSLGEHVALAIEADRRVSLTYVREGEGELSALILLLDDEGRPLGIMLGERVLPMDQYQGAAVDLADNRTMILAGAASFLGSLCCEMQGCAGAGLREAMQPACDSFMMMTLLFIQDGDLIAAPDTVIRSSNACSTAGPAHCPATLL